MSIWFKNYGITEINKIQENTLSTHIGIEFIEIGEDYLIAKMPVDSRTKMPRGLIHGGANCVLAETLASVAANLIINPETHVIVGLEINANHVRSATEGFVFGTCKPYHLGNSTQVWEIKIKDAQDKLTCISRMTIAILPKR